LSVLCVFAPLNMQAAETGGGEKAIFAGSRGSWRT
jgi:hypothetical protein